MGQTTNYITRDELRMIERGKAQTAWWNPKTDALYVDESNRQVPIWNTMSKAFDLGVYKEAKKKFADGKLTKADLKEEQYNAWSKEWYPIFLEAESAAQKGIIESANVITNSNFSSIDQLTVLQRLLGTNIRPFAAHMAPQQETSDSLELDVDVYTRFTINSEVPEGVAPAAGRGSIATTSFDLTKDVGHVAITDEANMKARKPLFETAVKNARDDFDRAQSANAATVFATLTDVALGDWAAFTSDHNTRNPYADIGGMIDTIVGNNGTPSILVSTNAVKREFDSSTFVKGLVASNPNVSAEAANVLGGVPGLPGFTWFVDNAMTAGTIIVADKEAVMKVQGPVRSGQYRQEQEGIDGYVIRNWYQIKVVQSGKGREGTGI